MVRIHIVNLLANLFTLNSSAYKRNDLQFKSNGITCTHLSMSTSNWILINNNTGIVILRSDKHHKSLLHIRKISFVKRTMSVPSKFISLVLSIKWANNILTYPKNSHLGICAVYRVILIKVWIKTLSKSWIERWS